MNKPAYRAALGVARLIKHNGANKRRVAVWCRLMRAALKG
jgi:hypothetical protein